MSVSKNVPPRAAAVQFARNKFQRKGQFIVGNPVFNSSFKPMV
jgi:hypothetical protein